MRLEQNLTSETEDRIEINPAIVGGSFAKDGMFGYQVHLLISSVNFSISCGGTIISEYFILSAGHCFKINTVKIFASEVLVLAGNIISLIAPYRSYLEHFVVHDNYESNLKSYDIALLKVADKIPFTENLYSIKLLTRRPKQNTKCYVSGWGVTEWKGQPSVILKYTTVFIVTDQYCKEYYTLKYGMLCAYREHEDTCTGDSGGPLSCNGQLAGVTSFGDKCAFNQKPGIYTDVTKYLEWIEETKQLMGNESKSLIFQHSITFYLINQIILFMLIMFYKSCFYLHFIANINCLIFEI